IILIAFLITQSVRGNASPLAKPLIKFVSFQKLGNGSGIDSQNAADFLDAVFWKEIRTALQNRPVTVQFLPGEYSRAYTEKGLELKDISHKKNKLTLEGDQSIFVVAADGEERPHLINIVNCENII